MYQHYFCLYSRLFRQRFSRSNNWHRSYLKLFFRGVLTLIMAARKFTTKFKVVKSETLYNHVCLWLNILHTRHKLYLKILCFFHKLLFESYLYDETERKNVFNTTYRHGPCYRYCSCTCSYIKAAALPNPDYKLNPV